MYWGAENGLCICLSMPPFLSALPVCPYASLYVYQVWIDEKPLGGVEVISLPALPLPPDNDIFGSAQGQVIEGVHDIQVTVHKIDEFSNTFGFFDRKDPYVLLQLGREKQNTSCKNDVRTCEKSRFYLMSCAVAGS